MAIECPATSLVVTNLMGSMRSRVAPDVQGIILPLGTCQWDSCSGQVWVKRQGVYPGTVKIYQNLNISRLEQSFFHMFDIFFLVPQKL